MRNDIIAYLNAEATAVNIQQVFISFLVSFIIGVLIFIAYKCCHSGTAYNGRFNVSLIILTLVSTLVMSVIGNNVALSLGMVGALSIVRFRTAIKDPRDTTYIFWCIAIGICCGVQSYMVAFVGSGVIFIAMLLFSAVKTNDRYLIIAELANDQQEKYEKEIQIYFDGKAKFSMQNNTEDSVEYIYEVSENVLNKSKKKNSASFATYLQDKVALSRFSLVMQMDEMSR